MFKVKNPQCCSTHKQISPINLDDKISAKIWANCLTSLPKLIHPDLTVFMKNRLPSDNIRKRQA